MDKSENIAMDATGNLTVPGLLSLQVKKNPDKEFIVFEDNDENISSITYLEFARRVNCLANHLTRAGVSKGDKIAVMLGNCPEFIVSWLAINQIGAVSVPVNVFYSADELAYLISNADCVGIILEPVFLKQFRATPAECQKLKACVLARSNSSEESFTLLSEIDANGDDADPGVHVTSDDPSQIIFTSGTTSRPKGVILDHRGSVNQGISTSMLLRMPSSERIGIVLPLFHVNGQFVGVIPALTVGGTIVLIETFSAQKYWSQVKKHDCSFISIVPMVLRTLLAQPPRDDDADHNISNCFYALPTSPEEWDSFEKRFGVTLIEGYGLTETYALCTANPIVYGETKRHCIGLPSIGREIRVVDDKMNNMPMGETGQIITRGGALFKEYYKDEEATKACMRDGWFFTGDNGFLDEDGYLHFFDRSKDMIKRSGENIAATEVERVLNDHPAILESAVIGVFDPIRDEAVKAFIVFQKGQSLSEDEIRDWCGKYLSAFKVPAYVEFRDELPKTSIGKIKKFVLKAEQSATEST